MIDFVRNLFGVRKKRKALPTSSVPQIGGTIIRNNVKVKVSQPIDPELWEWMQLSGWRVNKVKNDRRKYLGLPKDALAQLAAVSPESRAQIHTSLLGKAAVNDEVEEKKEKAKVVVKHKTSVKHRSAEKK